MTNLILGKNGNSPSWVTTTLLLNSSWQPWQGLRHSCELWIRRWQSEQSCTLYLEVLLFNSLVLFPYLLPSGQLWFSSFQEGWGALEFNMVTARDGNLISCFLVFQTLTSFFCSFCNFNWFILFIVSLYFLWTTVVNFLQGVDIEFVFTLWQGTWAPMEVCYPSPVLWKVF